MFTLLCMPTASFFFLWDNCLRGEKDIHLLRLHQTPDRGKAGSRSRHSRVLVPEMPRRRQCWKVRQLAILLSGPGITCEYPSAQIYPIVIRSDLCS